VRQIPAVQVLRRVWIQQFCREIDSATGQQQVRRREEAPDGDGLPPAGDRIISPYDLDARWGVKRNVCWPGYKVHFTETCNPPGQDTAGQDTAGQDTAGQDTAGQDKPPCARGRRTRRRRGRGEIPNLITNVETTPATVPDTAMTTPIHQRLDSKGLLPGEHLTDSGYASADTITAARLQGLQLIAPARQDHSRQARTGSGYDQSAFTVDYATRTATCPEGKTNSSWTPVRINGTDKITARWTRHDCQSCPARPQCTRAGSRTITIHHQDQHEALTAARAGQATPQWRASYAPRAGAEGTMRQAAHVTGVRHARYQGLPKTALEHNLAATAINLIRLDAYWTGHPLKRTRHSHLARLDFTTTTAA
jgi:hypothetical protein